MSNVFIESRTLSGSAKSIDSGESILLGRTNSNSVSNKLVRFVTKCQREIRDDNLRDYDPSLPSCTWIGGVFEYTGYQKMNRYMTKHLNEFGSNVKLYSFLNRIDIPLEEALEIAHKGHCSVPKDAPVIYGAIQSTDKNEYVVHYTMNESQILRSEGFIEGLKKNDEIWVPSKWNKKLLEETGIGSIIKVMPLGIDEEVFKPVEDRVSYTSGTNEFVFLAVSSWVWRKGWENLIEAFCKAFDGNKKVSLVIHTLEGTDIYNHEISHVVNSIKTSSSPHIVHSNALIPEEMMSAVYCSADAFALLSMGEGWGLPYSEAAACQVPIIGSYTTGHTEYLDGDYSYLVEPDLWVKPHESMKRCSDVYDNSVFAGFSKTALSEVISKMKYVYRNYDEAKNKAVEFGEKFVNEYSWKKSAEKVYNRIVELNKITGTL
jgi:glycosyltransferase involved in cell wall biosynthesis